jgi:hypothetical protein
MPRVPDDSGHSKIYPTRCNFRQFIYIWKLHVSGGTITHHQERKQLYLQHLVFVTTLLLPAAIVEVLELHFQIHQVTVTV